MIKRISLALAVIILLTLLFASGAIYTDIAIASNDNPGPTNYPGNGSPWAQPPKNGLAGNDNPGPTSYPGNGSPWAQPPKNGLAANDNPGPTSYPGNGSPWAQPPKGKA